MTCPFIDPFLQRTNLRLGNLSLRIVSVHNVQTCMQTCTYNFTEDKMFVTNGHIFANQPTFFLFGQKRVNKLFRHGFTLHRLFYMAENGQ